MRAKDGPLDLTMWDHQGAWQVQFGGVERMEAEMAGVEEKNER